MPARAYEEISYVVSNLAALGAAFSMSLGIFGLVGSEYLPASLLTPMAVGLGITEGMAGQAVTVTAVVAVVTSILVSAVIGRIDRRTVLMVFTLLPVLSNLAVAITPDFTTLLIARVLLGIALGGFWSLSAVAMMRLVPEPDVPKALAILFGGVSAATVFAAPFGSYFSDLYGWRAVFVAAAGLGVAALVMQWLTLPSKTSRSSARLGTVFAVLARPGIGLRIFSILLIFAGHFAFFTYLSPFLQGVTQVVPSGTTLILLLFGIGTFVGNSLRSVLIGRSLRRLCLWACWLSCWLRSVGLPCSTPS